MQQKIRNVALFILTLLVALGLIYADVYREEARRTEHPELNCQSGWQYMVFADVEACVRPLEEDVDMTILNNQSENAVRITHNANEGWLFSGAPYPQE